MGFFPIAPNDGDEVGPNTNGTYFKYSAANDAWYIIANAEISDDIYDASGWDTNIDGATKNAIRDKIELMILDINDAIHDDVDNEIFGISNKVTPASADIFVIEDSAVSYAKKKLTYGNLEGALSLANFGTRNHGSLSDAPTDAHHAQSHDNTYHSTNYKVDFSENSAFNKNFGTLGTEVCVGNDARLSDARDADSILTKEFTEGGGALVDADIMVYRTSTGKWELETKPASGTTPTLDEAFDQGKIIDGATSEANAFSVGDGSDELDIYASDGDVKIYQNDATSGSEKGYIGAGETITNLRPDTDVATQSWVSSDGGVHYDDINEDITQPTAGGGAYNYTGGAAKSNQFELPDIVGLVKDVTVWVEGYTNDIIDNYIDIYIDYNDGGGYILIGRTTFNNSGYAWDSVSSAGINKDGVGWKIRITQPNNIGAYILRCNTLYVAATHSDLKPFRAIYADSIYDDDGTIGTYSIVDDLQLLRDMKEYKNEKVLNPNFPEFTQKVWDVETLPWVVAHPNVDIMSTEDNNKRYQSSHGQKIGFIVSTLKIIVEKLDNLEARMLELENK